MSLSLTNVQQTEFDALVKMLYQSTGFKLRDCIRTKSDVTGYQVQFRRMDQIVANATGWQHTIPLQDNEFSAVHAQLVKYTAATGVDEVQDLTNNFSAKEENARSVAAAIGRRSDQIILTAIDDNAHVDNKILDGGTNLTYSKLRNVIELFEENNVPMEDRYLTMSGNNLRALLAADQIISRFYTSNNAVESGNLNYQDIMSMNVRVIGKMKEGGLGKTTDIRRCQAWNKQAVGLAVGQDFRTEVNYLPQSVTWLVNGIYYAGAVVVDDTGLIQIKCDESVNP